MDILVLVFLLWVGRFVCFVVCFVVCFWVCLFGFFFVRKMGNLMPPSIMAECKCAFMQVCNPAQVNLPQLCKEIFLKKLTPS